MAKWAFSPFRNREGFSVTHWIGSPSLFYPVRTLRETKMTVSLLVLMNSNRVSLRENESVLLLSDLECNTTREEVIVASPQEYKNPFVPDYRADYDYTFLHVNSANGNKQERSFWVENTLLKSYSSYRSGARIPVIHNGPVVFFIGVEE